MMEAYSEDVRLKGVESSGRRRGKGVECGIQRWRRMCMNFGEQVVTLATGHCRVENHNTVKRSYDCVPQ